jgi:hypothetical protein
VLCSGAALALTLLSPTARAEDEDSARSKRPQAGDLLAFFEGDRAGQVIKPDDLKSGGPPALAWPMDPGSKALRDGSRFNQVLLIRLDPNELEEGEKPRAADGVVGFSAICTHAQCTVAGWVEDKQVFQCPCHQSRYDPKHGARVVFGPAPRALPALPLKIDSGNCSWPARSSDGSGWQGRVWDECRRTKSGFRSATTSPGCGGASCAAAPCCRAHARGRRLGDAGPSALRWELQAARCCAATSLPPASTSAAGPNRSGSEAGTFCSCAGSNGSLARTDRSWHQGTWSPTTTCL